MSHKWRMGDMGIATQGYCPWRTVFASRIFGSEPLVVRPFLGPAHRAGGGNFRTREAVRNRMIPRLSTLTKKNLKNLEKKGGLPSDLGIVLFPF